MTTQRLSAAIQADIDAIGRIDSVATILDVIAETTGLRVAFIARISQESWTACAVLDRAEFGLKTGDQLELATTL